MNKGQFIVIEGLEGAGKSTALETLKECLTKQGIDFIATREPGGTPLAEQLRDILKHYQDEAITAQSELLLMYAARSQLVENVIKPALNQGKWVLGDRHDLSSRAYQGGGRQISMDTLNQLRDLTLGNFRPALTLYLDIDPVKGLARAKARGQLDRIEQQQLDFFKRARAVYLDEVTRNPQCIKIDAGQSLDDVQQSIRKIVTNFLHKPSYDY
ncbi:dTMP kinase [Celerinatantimonas diazotrophica]|uniref:Thymidylate kinase n=1 Tax=Celerinatantimonas diazotrophica TaxID=412034 RepID=A0A4V2PNM8_9GAMM|nr:dTMP kinase [Celerinatantimonas diazotrophica]TCK47641.1 thymidylate kinase [Celerinatantimonas diazotrophica]CAG9296736.1 Thymidylate kinase [Celerinatantimonas diazotrophica]